MKIARRGFLGLFAPALAAAVLLPAARPAEEDEYSMVLVDPPEWDVIEVRPEDSPLWGAYMEAQVKAKAKELRRDLHRMLYAQYDWCDCYYCRLGRRR